MGDLPVTFGPMGEAVEKTPRTERGRRTLRSLLDAAAAEFGEKGFHNASISGITSRAGAALGSFYTYFDSKDAIFRALVRDMSSRVKTYVAPALADAGDQLEAEREALRAFLEFARENKEIYRIVDEAEFVDPEAYRQHYESTAERIRDRLQAAASRGEVRADVGDVHAWAIMGMNVFLGLRYAVWSDEPPAEIAAIASEMIASGLKPRDA